ncbi:MAG: HAD-IA family hydrolase [Gammaproteobacteria bacterium]|nr:HAD-IA family hydrolase [Gammaproteobacteria bacterium]MCW9003638.1 HAD-IA family hydrolase [Gammaproteobacteria bacterium]
MSKIKTVLFDLDGTLIDTAPDMANALNILLTEENKPVMSFQAIRPVVSNGSVALVKLGFGDHIEDEQLARLKARYLEIYQQHLCEDSVLFDGMDKLLNHIEQQNMNWGVVTNKPGWLTDPLMEQMGLFDRAACVVSGDTTTNRKPHPEPMYHACLAAGSKPFECIYVGDHRRDIEAGNNAGMKTIVALFGYINDEDNTDNWGADISINHPDEIIEHLKSAC